MHLNFVSFQLRKERKKKWKKNRCNDVDDMSVCIRIVQYVRLRYEKMLLTQSRVNQREITTNLSMITEIENNFSLNYFNLCKQWIESLRTFAKCSWIVPGMHFVFDFARNDQICKIFGFGKTKYEAISYFPIVLLSSIWWNSHFNRINRFEWNLQKKKNKKKCKSTLLQRQDEWSSRLFLELAFVILDRILFLRMLVVTAKKRTYSQFMS